MKLLGHLAVFPRLPERIHRLEELAYNLWWAWHPEAQSLFSRLDDILWEETNHNPVKLLQHVEQERLERAVRDAAYVALYDAVMARFDAYMGTQKTWFSQNYPDHTQDVIAYFS
ncbi:MAG: alpha-glucan phosphorylase, partial [Candidatus Neomarinimicrobiota bacterium]